MKFISKCGKTGEAQRRAPLWSRLALAATMMLGAFGSAHAALLTATLEDATNGGGFFAVVTLEDTDTDQVTVTVDIAEPINVGLTQGDILSIFFDVDNFALLSGLQAVNGDPTTLSLELAIDENNVDSIGSPPNPESINPLGPFDLGVALGANGAAEGFIQTLSFDLIGASGFSTATFVEQSIGLRVTSIEGVDTYIEGSSKLIGTPPPNEVPVPGTVALLGAGLLGFSVVRRRRTLSAVS